MGYERLSHSHARTALWLVLLSTAGASDVQAGGLLNPASFASLGQLPDEVGTYSINTSGAIPVMTLPDGTTLNGALDPTGQVAVFTFSSVQLNGWAEISVTGSRAFALLSQGDMTIENAWINGSANGSVAGPGGFSLGGPGAGISAQIGGAAGGGGGGGGFGGAGGAGAPGYYTQYTIVGGYPGFIQVPLPGGPGGVPYASGKSPLQGGSAGGRGDFGPSDAGAGGGAIELGATGSIHLTSTYIAAEGGTLLNPFSPGGGSGGGSGGSISLLGTNLFLNGVGLDASGGAGENGLEFGGPGSGMQGPGGGGGGGLIDLAGILVDPSYGVNLQGGAGAGPGADGILILSVPEPSALVLGGIAAATGLAIAIGRKRLRSPGERARLLDRAP